VPTSLFFALAAVYLVGVVGIVVVGSILGSADEAPAGLDDRLAHVRATERPLRKRSAATTTSTPYFVRLERRR
jgi:hypothetical protein